MKLRLITLLSFVAVLPNIGYTKQYSTPEPGSDVIGQTEIVYPQSGESLIDIGIRYEAGYEELQWANPDINNWTPSATTPIILPFQFILPAGKREGIVSNIPEMRTYYFPKGEDVVYVYPVSVGRMDWKTPLGTWRVTVKQKDPAWYPPKSIRQEHVETGRGFLPSVVPPGPDNPLGSHVLRLSIPSYLLHGTNDDSGIGMRVTHGCMRFFPHNIEELYNIVPSGTPVTFVNQPVKIGWHNGELMMEVHPPLDEDNLGVDNIRTIAYQLLRKYQNDPTVELVDQELIDIAIRQMSGIPIHIGATKNSEGTYTDSAIDIDWDNFKKKK